MRKLQVVGLGAVLWAALAALPAQAVVLRYMPEVGSTTTYNLTMKGDMSMSMPGMPEGAGGELSATMTMVQKALAKQEDGTKVETRITGGTVKSSMGGEEVSQQVPAGQMVMVLDARGRMAQLVSSDLGGQSAQMGVPGMQDWGALSGFGGFPEGDVKVGDVWTDEVKLPGGGAMPEMNLQVRSRLAELTTYEGHKAARISSSFSGPISADLAQLSQGAPQQVQGAMSGDIKGNFVCYYDYEKSAYVHSQGRFTMNIDTHVTGGQEGMPAMHMKMQMTLEVSAAK